MSNGDDVWPVSIGMYEEYNGPCTLDIKNINVLSKHCAIGVRRFRSFYQEENQTEIKTKMEEKYMLYSNCYQKNIVWKYLKKRK